MTERRPIPVYYSPKQTAPRNDSFSPSAQKPALVMEAWREMGIPLRVIEPEPVTIEELSRAHDRGFVEGVLGGRIQNGFGNTLAEVNATLPWTSGSLRSAVMHAARTGESCFSPTSGFHHAHHAHGCGYCTFNGLMVAALALRAEDPSARVAIVDCDCHYGDGTDEIIAYTRSSGWVAHHTFGEDPPTSSTAEAWLRDLPAIVERTIAGCAVAIYQAGADPHIADPLGGILTSAQMAERDRVVFSQCAAAGVPVVTNLAGGYQKPVRNVVALHVQTLKEFAAIAHATDT